MSPLRTCLNNVTFDKVITIAAVFLCSPTPTLYHRPCGLHRYFYGIVRPPVYRVSCSIGRHRRQRRHLAELDALSQSVSQPVHQSMPTVWTSYNHGCRLITEDRCVRVRHEWDTHLGRLLHRRRVISADRKHIGGRLQYTVTWTPRASIKQRFAGQVRSQLVGMGVDFWSYQDSRKA